MTGAQLLVNAQLVCGGQVVPQGWLLTQGHLVDAVGGSGQPPPAIAGVDAVDVRGDFVLPGFVDVHVHGGGGNRFGDDPSANRGVRDFHARHGTTSVLAGVVTAPLNRLHADLKELGSTGQAADAGARLLGIHLEGPYIAASRCGAHNPADLRLPDRAEADGLLQAANGQLRLITAAPELPAFADLLAAARQGGCYVSAGHTDATAEQLLAAFANGARSLTHTLNAMRKVTHRDPGPLAAVADSDVFCELICDGIHIAPGMVRVLRRLAGPCRIVLVTDACAWAGEPDGTYSGFGRQVEVRDGAARIAGTDTLAGSMLTMAEAARRYVSFTGADMVELAAVTAGNPSRLIGQQHRLGVLQPGYLADLVVLDQSMSCTGVMLGGRWLRRPATATTAADGRAAIQGQRDTASVQAGRLA